MIATFMNKAPANVLPIILNLGLLLKACDLIGRVPTQHTTMKKSSIKRILSKLMSKSDSILVYYFLIYEIKYQ